jgi:hypothetical protein
MPSWRELNCDFPELLYNYAGVKESDFYFVSHRWDDTQHPDPSGWQLNALIKFGESCIRRGEHNACVWLDYMSLPQEPRGADEDAIFRSGLQNIRKLLDLNKHVMLVSETGEYAEEDLANMLLRAWIVYETFIVRERTMASHVIYQRDRGAVNYGAEEPTLKYAADLSSLIATDRAEFIHAWLEKQNITCTHGSDLVYLSKLIHEEINKFNHKTPPPGITFGQELFITNKEMLKYEIRMSTKLSSRFPNIYAISLQDVLTGGKTYAYWKARFVYRPPVPPLNIWSDCSQEDFEAMMIDAGTRTSPMYPGLIFEFNSRDSRILAKLS